jgi:hypothetical protein
MGSNCLIKIIHNIQSSSHGDILQTTQLQSYLEFRCILLKNVKHSTAMYKYTTEVQITRRKNKIIYDF